MLSFCVASVALGDIYLRFAWQAWRLWHWAGSGGSGGWHHLVTHHLSHTIFDTPSFTDRFVNTIFHTPLCHTPSLTHHFVTHHLSHTIFDTPSLTHPLSHTLLQHTIFHTPSFTHPLSHTISVTHHLSHTIFHTPSFIPNFVTHHL